MRPLLPVPVVAVLLLTAAASAAASASPAGHSVIAVSESGVLHLDTSGTLLARRPEVFQWWQAWNVATNPRNGTVCWVSVPGDRSAPSAMRCALVADLNQTWDLPPPRGFSLSKPDAVAFDWVEENWYLTVSRVSYVCSYMFGRCAMLGKSGGSGRFFAAYDIPNRLLLRIVSAKTISFKLEVLNLDGSGLQDLPTNLTYPAGLAVDPINRQIYVIDEGEVLQVGLYKLDWDGKGKELVMPLDTEEHDISWRRSLDVINGTGVAMYGDQRIISAFSAADGQGIDLVEGAVKGETVIVKKLLAVKIFSPETQPEVENPCVDATCSELCIPTVVNGTAEASCLCPEGERLVDLGCRAEYPLYAVVTGGDKLQVVDMQTEEMTTILSGLTDVSRVDFFWTGGEEFLLFWVDEGGLFRGRWLSSGSVSDVQELVKASETRKVLDVAVDWVHRHLIWMERNSTKSKYSKQVNIMLSPLDGAYQKTIANDYWYNKRAMFVFNGGQSFGYAQQEWARVRIVTRKATGSTSWSDLSAYSDTFLTSLPNEVVVDHSLAGLAWQDRFFWVSFQDHAIEFVSKRSAQSEATLSRLLTHPSLADAGGLDVLDSRLFWTERSTGLLWTADSETGGNVHVLPATTAGGSLRLLHPWRQPPPTADHMPCDDRRGGCSHFCLTGLAAQKRVPSCECPNNMELEDDGKTCQPL